MALKRSDEEAPTDKRKKKRVGFAEIDSGIEPRECLKIFLVRYEKEVGEASNTSIDPVDLDQFFGEEGKIYGYKGLKINVWLSIVSFRAYAEIMFDSKSDGGKGITDLEPALKNIFGDSLVEKNEFLQSFSMERRYVRDIVSSGVVVNSIEVGKNHLDDTGFPIEVIQMELNSMPVGAMYSRLVPLVLLLIEGSRPVDITDPRWGIYVVVKKMPDHFELLGFATVYRFYHYPDSTRLRISQILVLPPFQGQGYGWLLLESVNSVALSKNAYDVTVEEPSDYLQHLRACIDTSRLLKLEPIKAAVTSLVSYLKEGNLSKRPSKLRLNPPAGVIESAREELKINRKQLLGCWEVLIYLNLDLDNQEFMKCFRALISERVKDDILDKDAVNNEKQLIEVPNDYNPEMSFVVFRSQGKGKSDNLLANEHDENQEKQLDELVDERMKEIVEIAKRVSVLHKQQ